MSSWNVLLIAAILSMSATGALAQTNTQPSAPHISIPASEPGGSMGTMPGAASGGMPMMGGQQMGGMPMMGMMPMMMGQSGMAAHVEGRIAFLRTELKITDAQMPLWDAVAEAIRAASKDTSMMPPQSSTLPEKLAAREKAMTAHLEAFRKFKAAVEPLYAALNDDQKKTADQLLVSPIAMMSMGMM